MRFSLTTLLLVAFWIAALLLVWMRREPWVLAATTPSTLGDLATHSTDAPDGVRSLASGDIHAFIVLDNRAVLTADVLTRTRLAPGYWTINSRFVDNDTIIAGVANDSGTYEWRYHRRFPEWWWGHFYRPEVWLATALMVVLIWRSVAGAKGVNKIERSDIKGSS